VKEQELLFRACNGCDFQFIGVFCPLCKEKGMVANKWITKQESGWKN
jgi:hypothetical protein